jgi:hypothetical protein
MRYIISAIAASVVIAASTSAVVAGPPGPWGPPGPPRHPWPHYPPPPDGWVAPLIAGTVLGAVIASQPRTVVVSEPPPPAVEEPPPPPGKVYKRVTIYIPECRCYRAVDVPID